MSTVTVKKTILQWVIDRSDLTIKDLQNKFPKIKQWVSGQSNPTLRQIESLAKITSTPLGFFFLETPPEERLPVPHFRTLGDRYKPSPDLLETVHIMQQRQSWMREYLVEQGQEHISCIRSANINEPPASIAVKMRRLLGFDEEWAALHPTWTEALNALRKAMEKAGILVVVNGIVGNNTHRKLDVSEFRGFVLTDDYAPLVFVNGADFKAAQMFTLAHELAHIFLGSSAAFDLRQMLPADDRTEKACNSTAAEFLIPGYQLQRIWPSFSNEPEPFHAVARRFKVSVLVAARRVLDMGLINKHDFLKFYQEYQKDERRKTAGRPARGDFYANQNLRLGQRFAAAVIQASREGKLLYTEAYKLTGLYGKSFEQYASHLGIGGHEDR